MSLAAIHILRKELGLTESEYRAILREVAGVDSAKYLDESGDRAVMARLYAIRDERREAAECRVKSPAERKIWGALARWRRPSGVAELSAGAGSHGELSARICPEGIREHRDHESIRPLHPDRERGISNH